MPNTKPQFVCPALLGLLAVALGCSSSSPESSGTEESGKDASETQPWGEGRESVLDATTSETAAPPETGDSDTTANASVSDDKPAPTMLGDVVFSVPSQAFQGVLSVELSTAVTDAEIRYTTDGSLPDANSTLHDGAAIELSQTVQLRSQAFVQGEARGEPSTALYVARNFDVQSDLPLIVVDGYGAGKPEDQDRFADMAFLVFEPSGGNATLSQLPTLATRAGYHLRGQSSASFDKAPYRVELWDNQSNDADHELLGMPAEADWALVGPFADRSLIRHAFAYSLGSDMGMTAPRYAFAEVYLNTGADVLDESHYEGVYMVVETIKNHKNRLDLKQLREDDVDPADISGGYIFKFDWSVAEEPTLSCTGSDPLGGSGFGGGGFNSTSSGGTCWTDLEVVDPTPLNAAQTTYLTDYLQQFHDSLHEDSLSEYSQYIDLDSFVDQFIINELTRDIDAYTRSTFFHKERDQPLKAGPLWDYNLTLGVGFGAHREVEGWQWQEREVASDWFRILAADPDFMSLVTSRWQSLRQGLLSSEQLLARVDALTTPLRNAAERDMERWPVSEVSGGIFQLPDAPTWQGQVDVLKTWMIDRVAWLDSQL